MIDEIINKVASQEAGYDKEAFKQKKKEQKEKAYQIIDESLEELKTNPDFFKTYLDVQSRFDMYTPRNALLIAKQMPSAIQLKTRNDWKDLKATFKSYKPNTITIIEPGESYKNANGETITPIYAKDVIDVSETNTKPNIRSYDKQLILQALISDPLVPIKPVDSLESGKVCEWNHEDKLIYVCRSDDYNLVIKALANELAKISLYENINEIDNDKADCISYMICKKFGIESQVNSIENLRARYSKMEKPDIANDLTSMKESLLDMNTKIRQYLEDKQRESKNKEQER